MQTGIIGGTGAEGRGLAARLATAGVHVLLGSRTIERATEAVARVQTLGSGLTVEPATNEAIVDRSDIIFLAVPFAAAGDFVSSHAARFRPGTIVVDLTVPMRFVDRVPVFDDVQEGSAAEHLRARLPPSVRLAASFKTMPASVLSRLELPLDCDEFVCADSPEARDATIEILGRIPNLRLLDAGGLDAARTLERMTLLAVRLNMRYHVRTARFRVVGIDNQQ
jgi:NADPH-dependent F420 reductase